MVPLARPWWLLLPVTGQTVRVPSSLRAAALATVTMGTGKAECAGSSAPWASFWGAKERLQVPQLAILGAG